MSPSLSSGPSFKIMPGSNCAVGVAAGSRCTLTIEFTPATVDVHLGTLTIVTNGAGDIILGLRGLANGVGTTNETRLHFGAFAVGGTAVLPPKVTNTGVPIPGYSNYPTVSYTISGSGYLVLASSDCVTSGVSLGQDCYLQVKFAPTVPGYDKTVMTVTSSTGTVSTVMLDGTGVAP